MADLFFDLAHDAADKIASAHLLYDRPAVPPSGARKGK